MPELIKKGQKSVSRIKFMTTLWSFRSAIMVWRLKATYTPSCSYYILHRERQYPLLRCERETGWKGYCYLLNFGDSQITSIAAIRINNFLRLLLQLFPRPFLCFDFLLLPYQLFTILMSSYNLFCKGMFQLN